MSKFKIVKLGTQPRYAVWDKQTRKRLIATDTKKEIKIYKRLCD